MTRPINLTPDLKNAEAATGLRTEVFTTSAVEFPDVIRAALGVWEDGMPRNDFTTGTQLAILLEYVRMTGPGAPVGLAALDQFPPELMVNPANLLEALARCSPSGLRKLIPPAGDAFRPIGFAICVHARCVFGDPAEVTARLARYTGRIDEYPDSTLCRVLVGSAHGVTEAITRELGEDRPLASPPPHTGFGDLPGLLAAAAGNLVADEPAGEGPQ